MENSNGIIQNNQVPPVYNYPLPQKDTFTKLDFIFSIIVFILGFIFTKFVLFNLYGFISTFFYIVMITSAIVYIKRKGYAISKTKAFEAGILILFSLTFSITANIFIKTLASIFILISGIYWVFSVCRNMKGITKTAIADIFIATLYVPFTKFSSGPKALFSNRSNKSGKNILFAIIGLICTLPMTAVVASLLMRADNRMANLVDFFFGNIGEKIFSNIFTFIFSIPVSLYIFGMLFANTVTNKESGVKEEGFNNAINALKFVPNAFTYAFVTPVCILYAMYFGLQLNYFISAFVNTLPDGFTYAEYARQGFFELFAICVINAILLLGINTFSKNSGNKQTIAMKIYNTLICVFTITIIVTALSKMIMYISRYGLTSLRVYTSWFMALIFLCFIAVLLKQFIKKINLTKTLASVFTICFFILCFSCPDAIIAKHNIEIYKTDKTNSLDVETLVELSDDAWVVILENEHIIKLKYNMERLQDEKDYKLRQYKNDYCLTYNIPSLIVYNKIK